MAEVFLCSLLPDGGSFESYRGLEVLGSGEDTIVVGEAQMGRLVAFAWIDVGLWQYPEDEIMAATCTTAEITRHEAASAAGALEGEDPETGWSPNPGTSGQQAWCFPRSRNAWMREFDA